MDRIKKIDEEHDHHDDHNKNHIVSHVEKTRIAAEMTDPGSFRSCEINSERNYPYTHPPHVSFIYMYQLLVQGMICDSLTLYVTYDLLAVHLMGK